jgi:hypothetical protein
VGGGRLPALQQYADPGLDVLTAGLVERPAGRRRQMGGEATDRLKVGLDGPGRLVARPQVPLERADEVVYARRCYPLSCSSDGQARRSKQMRSERCASRPPSRSVAS